MPTPRCLLVPEGLSRCYHCVSRCVRQSYLCGGRSAHRKDWIKDRLLELDQTFAIDVGGFAVMDNHLHVLVRTHPTRVQEWSDEEVVRRWLSLYPGRAREFSKETGIEDAREIVRGLAADPHIVDEWRNRLTSLSWFMKCLKEPIARRANREDDVTGHFWQGRFKSQPLLDEAAVVACLVYIDLNPIRAGMAITPETSNYTSAHDRIRVRASHRNLRQAPPSSEVTRLIPHATLSTPAHDEDGIWLIPIEVGDGVSARPGLVEATLDEYLELLDLTGREARSGKRGRIPAELKPILSRLDIDAERWIDAMTGRGRRIGSAIGTAASLANEARRRGTKWVVNALPIFAV